MIEKTNDNSFLWNQFCKLGEMMGDGLHLEADGKWITKEYNQLARILIPEIRQQDKEKRKLKAIHVNEQMDKLLQNKSCECGGRLKQGRSGTKIAYCMACNKRYRAGKSKNKK